VTWLDKKYYVTAVGFIIFVECLGALCGQSAIVYMYHFFNLQKTILFLSILSVFLLVLTYFLVEDSLSLSPANKLKECEYKVPWVEFTNMFKDRHYWILAGCAALFWAPAALFASLWGIDFVVENNKISKFAATHMLTFVWLGIGLGGPLIGLIVQYFNKKILLLGVFSFLGFMVSILIIFFTSSSLLYLSVLLFLLGITCAAQVLTFGIINDYSPKKIIATAFGFNNMVICFGNALFQFLGGFLLDLFWRYNKTLGVRTYSLSHYKKMLLLMPSCYVIIALLLIFLLRERIIKYFLYQPSEPE
jgi:MFS family permease